MTLYGYLTCIARRSAGLGEQYVGLCVAAVGRILETDVEASFDTVVKKLQLLPEMAGDPSQLKAALLEIAEDSSCPPSPHTCDMSI